MLKEKVMLKELATPIYWIGDQWAVTSFGVECLVTPYEIEKHRLWENEDTHSWEQHMSEKNWIDNADFAAAIRFARKKFGQLDPKRKT